jgi:hypothetical protein
MNYNKQMRKLLEMSDKEFQMFIEIVNEALLIRKDLGKKQ